MLHELLQYKEHNKVGKKYLHISNQMRKQDKTKYRQEYTIQSLTKIGTHNKSLAIAAVWKMKEIYIISLKPYIRLLT
jgi:acyl-[acyl carrier protein]--UDP-N-acetylglucosamine O-acyltransferase